MDGMIDRLARAMGPLTLIGKARMMSDHAYPIVITNQRLGCA